MSITATILNAVRQVVEDLHLPSVYTVIRKRLWVGERDNLPLVVVSPGQPTIESEHTENTTIWKRLVLVAIATPTGDGELEADAASLPDLEESIRQALHKPTLSGATSVFQVDLESDPVFIPGGVDAGYDMTILTFTYWSEETRSV